MSSLKTILDEYVAGPALLRQAVAGMTAEQLRAAPVPGKWSTLAVVAHLADFDPIIADRLKRVLALDNPLLIGADENRFAAVLAYDRRDVEEELVIIEKTRSQIARIFSDQPDSVLARTGNHTERGSLTLDKLFRLAINHIPHHVKFIEEKRRALRLPQ